jgi:hypothetical protein
LFCLLDPKGPSTERVEFLYISPTVPWTKTPAKKTFRFSNSLSRVALFGLLIKKIFLRALDCQLAQVKRFTGKKPFHWNCFFVVVETRFFISVQGRREIFVRFPANDFEIKRGN